MYESMGSYYAMHFNLCAFSSARGLTLILKTSQESIKIGLGLDCACIFYFNCGGTFYFQEIAHLKVHDMSCLFQKISAPPTGNHSCGNHPAQESSFLHFYLLKHLTTHTKNKNSKQQQHYI